MSSKFGAKIIKFRHLCKFFDIFLHFFALSPFNTPFPPTPLSYSVIVAFKPNERFSCIKIRLKAKKNIKKAGNVWWFHPFFVPLHPQKQWGSVAQLD